MKVTLMSEGGDVYRLLEVGSDLTVRDLQALAELETSVPVDEMLLVHNMAPLANPLLPLTQCGVEEGDVIMVSRLEGGVANVSTPPTQTTSSSQATVGSQQATAPLTPNIDWGSVAIPTTSNPSNQPGNRRQQQQQRRDPEDPETVRQHFLDNPHQLSQLRQQNPPLAEALLSGDRERFRAALEQHRQAVRDAERERIRMLNADPLDPTYQAKIGQDIRQRNIEENMETAIEFTPEIFGNVFMLYLKIKVNGVSVTALVDSGARSTVMSQACAERCNIMRLVDRRFSGIAYGVGQQRILGRVHLGQLQIGQDFLPSSFTVLETTPEDMLIGLDMLKRHQCCIDLKENCIRIGTTGNATPFLTEKDLENKEDALKKQEAEFTEKEDFEMAQAMAESEQATHKDQGSASGSSQATALSSRQPPRQQDHTHNASPTRSTPDEGAIGQIVAMGFSREEAVRELRNTGGQVQLAITALLAKSISL